MKDGWMGGWMDKSTRIGGISNEDNNLYGVNVFLCVCVWGGIAPVDTLFEKHIKESLHGAI